jgi:hypothetical protein
MADWTDPPYAQLVAGKAWTDEKAAAAFENLVAALEGAPGAPRVKFAALDAAFSTAGGVGTYVFAAAPSLTTVAFGATVGGSTLQPTSAVYSVSISSASVVAAFSLGSTLSGTWRCMGTFTKTGIGAGGAPAILGATLWLRIS